MNEWKEGHVWRIRSLRSFSLGKTEKENLLIYSLTINEN